jgi:hypothetical protein
MGLGNRMAKPSVEKGKYRRHDNRHGNYNSNRECIIPLGPWHGFGHPILFAAVPHQRIPQAQAIHKFECGLCVECP